MPKLILDDKILAEIQKKSEDIANQLKAVLQLKMLLELKIKGYEGMHIPVPKELIEQLEVQKKLILYILGYND